MSLPAGIDFWDRATVAWSVGDWTFTWLVVVALFFFALQKKLPVGLGIAVFSAAASVALAVLAFEHFQSEYSVNFTTAFLPLHIAAAICLLWGMFAWAAAAREAKRSARGETIEPPTVSAMLFAWSLVTGVAAAVLLVHPMVFTIWDRLVSPGFSTRRLAPDGLWDISALMVTTGAWACAGRRRQQPVLLLGLAAAFVVWTSLMVAPGEGYGAGPRFHFPGPVPFSVNAPGWWSWTLHLQVWMAGVLLVATVLQDLRFRRRQRLAWPDRLDDLIRPYSDWPGYAQVEAVMASIVLILGVYQIVRAGPWDWRPNAVSLAACAGSGTVCMFVSYRRWSPNTTELGVASITLACMMVPTIIAARLVLDPATTEYASRMPTIFNAALFGLAVMIAYWSWLGAFWKQQLHDDKTAWTTAGRMISPLRRANFLVASLAVMIAFQMALWPERVPTGDLDDGIGRMAAGLAVLMVLAGFTAVAALRTKSPAFASLSICFIMAAGVFAMIRLRGWHERGVLVQYSPIFFSGFSIPVLLLSELAGKRDWRMFAQPLNILALLLLPAVALWHVIPTSQLPASLVMYLPAERLPTDWIRPLTLAVLAGTFALAGRREGHRPFFALTAVLLVGAALSAYRGSGQVALPLGSSSLHERLPH